MPNSLLTDEERKRFASWLEAQAESDKLLIGQLEKLGHADPVVQMMRRRIAAYGYQRDSRLLARIRMS